MCDKWYLLIVAFTLLFTSCSQTRHAQETPTIVPSATITTQSTAAATLTVIASPTSHPTLTPDLKPTKSQSLTSVDSIQIKLFRLVPPDFLGAGYNNLGLIREDPDLKSAFESSPNDIPFLDSQILESSVDRLMGFSRVPHESLQVRMAIIYILHGDFSEITLPELIQEFEYEGPILQEYQGFELMVEEQGEPFNSAAMIMDKSTIVFGEAGGVKAVIDTALDSESSPLADLSAALPQVFMASVLNHCPQLEDLGCTAAVVPGLAQGTSPDISYFHIYEFEDPDSAATALDVIQKNAESGNLTQTGSIKMSGDIIIQEGRYIILEDLIAIEDIGDVFQ